MLTARKAFGNLLSIVGSPAYYLWKLGLANLSKVSEKPSHLVWALPLGLSTAPLFAVALVGESILLKCERAEFQERTKSLPKIYLPNENAYIIKSEEFGKKQYFVYPFYLDDEEPPFDSKEEACKFLQSLGYQEVVALNYEHYLDTYWVKPKNIK